MATGARRARQSRTVAPADRALAHLPQPKRYRSSVWRPCAPAAMAEHPSCHRPGAPCRRGYGNARSPPPGPKSGASSAPATRQKQAHRHRPSAVSLPTNRERAAGPLPGSWFRLRSSRSGSQRLSISSTRQTCSGTLGAVNKRSRAGERCPDGRTFVCVLSPSLRFVSGLVPALPSGQMLTAAALAEPRLTACLKCGLAVLVTAPSTPPAT